MSAELGQPFRVAFVAGVTPDKWVRRWRERHRQQPLEVFLVDERDQLAVLRDGRAEMSLVRLPVDTDGLHLIRLYEETPVVVVSRDHVVAAFDRIDVRDLIDEHTWDLTEVGAAEAVQAVAAGTGVVVLPQSVARLHHRKDVVAVPVDGVAVTAVGLAWRRDVEDPRLDQLVGIVRGRTERSSRGAPEPAEPPGPPRPPRVTSPRAAGGPRGNRRRTGNRGRPGRGAR